MMSTERMPASQRAGHVTNSHLWHPPLGMLVLANDDSTRLRNHWLGLHVWRPSVVRAPVVRAPVVRTPVATATVTNADGTNASSDVRHATAAHFAHLPKIVVVAPGEARDLLLPKGVVLSV
jgi:hypothetical protein